MTIASITLTDLDRSTLSRLLALRKATHLDVRPLTDLAERLDEAVVVSSEEVPPSVVTLNSRIRIRTLGTDDERVLTLVVPGHADIREGRVSVLTPVGTALLGRREGEVVECAVPVGRVAFQIETVLYQPEQAGTAGAVAVA